MTNSNKQDKPDLSRRNFLRKTAKVTAGITVLVSGGLVWRAFDQDVFSPFDGEAYQPWADWKNEKLDGPMALIPSAILASSPHNTQPWLFEISDNRIIVLADTKRHLGSFDPYLREMHIGLGCAIENILIAASAHGYNADVDVNDADLTGITSRDEFREVAAINLTIATIDPDPLFQEIPNRHTYRGTYDKNRQPTALVISEFTQAAAELGLNLNLYQDHQSRSVFDTVMMVATTAIVADMTMVHDSEAWFRFKASDVEKHKDGVTMDSVGLPDAMTVAAKMAPPLSPEDGHQIWLNTTRDTHLASAPATGAILVNDRFSAKDNMNAGRLWQRMHLIATKHGLSMHPMNQPVEWMDRLKTTDKTSADEAQPFISSFNALTGNRAKQTTFSFRMGYAEKKGALSPRRGLQQVIKTT